MSIGNSIIGALRVVFGADTAQFDTALKDSSKNLKAFGVSAVTVGALAADAIKGAANAIAFAFSQALEQGNKIAGLSRSLGVAVEQLSALKYAALASGNSLEELGEGLKGLQARMVEALADNRSSPARAFAAIGMSAKDLQRDATAVFLDLAQKFQSFADGPAKQALADAFGIGQLLPLLNRGKDGIQQFMAEAQRLGLVMTTQGAAGAEEFRRTLERLDTQKRSFAETVTLRVVPSLTLLAQHLEKTNSSGKAWGETIGNLLNTTLREFLFLVQQSGPAWSSLMQGLSGNKQAAQDAALGLQAMREAMRAYRGEVDLLTESGLPMPFNQIAQAAAPAIESARLLTERMAALKAEITTFIGGPSQEFAAKMFAIQEALKRGHITAADSITLSAQVTQQAISAQKAALVDLLNTPVETFATKMAAVNQAYADGTINATEFAAMSRKVNKENVDNWSDLAGAASNAVSAIFGHTKAGAIAAAIINTAQGVTKAIADGGFFGFAKAALVAAAGAAQIAKIKSTNIAGGKGSSGGGGSAPSVPAAAAAAEPAQAATPANLPSQTITVTGIRPDDMISGEAVRRLAEKLLTFQRNGGMVVFQPS